MKFNCKTIIYYTFINICLLTFGNYSSAKMLDFPQIFFGNSTITGSLNMANGEIKEGTTLHFVVFHPVSLNANKQQTVVDSEGKFSLDIDLETTSSLIYLYSSVNPMQGMMVKSNQGETTHLEVYYNEEKEIQDIKITPDMNRYDMLRYTEILNKLISHESDREPTSFYKKRPEDFVSNIKKIVKERLEIYVDNDSLLSQEFKELLSREFMLYSYIHNVFDYERSMMLHYYNFEKDKTKSPEIEPINRTYFSFLKDFNLNNPQYLHNFTLIEFQTALFENEVLNIPPIGDKQISDWQDDVKDILAELIGFEEGQYYDLLAAHAYIMQLDERLIPLTEIQKANIHAYWKNGEIAKILFNKNSEILELAKFQSAPVIHDVSGISPEKTLENILEKYKDKVVFIDFWATWCAPCLDAMKEFRSIKGEFYDKDVEFVYFSNSSSPKKLWEDKLQGIGGEHYYLDDEQWQYLMNEFGFTGIPSYLLFNKKGAQEAKFTGFPGNNRVKELLNKLLE